MHPKYRKIILLLAIALALALILLIVTKAYLYINVLLGYDVIISLLGGEKFISLYHGQNATMEFTSSVTTNPFCAAYCNATLLDLSMGTAISKNNFTLRPGMPYDQEIIFSAPVSCKAQLKIYNMFSEVVQVKEVEVIAGNNRISISANDLSSGIYTYSISNAAFKIDRMMSIIR